MTLVKYRPLATRNPFALARSFQDELDRNFSRLFCGADSWEGSLTPHVDVAEGDDEITVYVELPGMTQEDFEIEAADGELILKGEKKQEHEETAGGYTHRERRYGSFHRRIALPATADTAKIEAELSNGTLKVRIPTKEECKPRQIPINVN